MLGEVQIRPVLQAQHHLLPLHPPQSPRPVRRQDILRRYLRVRRLVDHPVVTHHHRLVRLRRRGKRRHRRLRLHPSAPHQPPAQALIPQPCSPQLVLGPFLPVQPLPAFQRLDRLRRQDSQLLPPVLCQRIQVDRLHRDLPIRGRKAHPSQSPMRRDDQIAQLRPRMPHRPSWMLPSHQPIPPTPLPLHPHQHQPQSLHPLHPLRYPLRRRNRFPQIPRRPPPAPVEGFR